MGLSNYTLLMLLVSDCAGCRLLGDSPDQLSLILNGDVRMVVPVAKLGPVTA